MKQAGLYDDVPGPVGDWGTVGQQPGVDTTQEHGVMMNQMVQKNPGEGRSMPTNTWAQLEAQGYWKCPGKLPNGQQCDFWLDPQHRQQIEHSRGYFTCPRCQHTFDLMNELPSHGLNASEEAFSEGGQTHIGLPLGDQGQIGENLIANIGEIPGYGRITWWHPGGATSQSPLDGATAEWGIEVKTIGYDATHHRFSPGGGGASPQAYKQEKDQMAAKMGLKGVLGILVLLDYRRDVADIYVKAMPLEPWEYQQGRFTSGVASWRKNSGQKLVAEVPFPNPYKDPNNPSPMQYNAEDYYNQPQAQLPESSEMPF